MSESRRPVASNGGYLSIREVLDSLIDEFDDITISKIRFLESRGLIHPERTPSGYRKFYPGDVERLRWILRQQRENFLPLKVIKRRLDVEDGRLPELPDNQSLFEEPSRQERELALQNVVSNIRHAKRATTADSGAESEGELEEKAIEPPSRKEVAETADEVTAHALVAPGTVIDQPQAQTDVEPQASPAVAPPLVDDPADRVPSTIHPAPPTVRPAPLTNELLGVAFNTEELAAAASTTTEAIDELEEFGFISSHNVGGVRCYDGDALVVAKAIVSLRTFGLEPRHLKSIRNAALRDATLYTQAVAPLLRQRNPEARARARQQLEELTTKGAALYEQILRLEIRRLGGA